ncbi:MAG: apolipoprotein N-acyltransferase [Deltaproteobacteria bacterium]|nr:apolipoprotein N-acyltransferase [Deltaproteobacteria bacterium]
MASDADHATVRDVPLARDAWVLAIASTGSLALALGAPPGGSVWSIWLGFAPLAWAAMRLRTRGVGRRFFAGWLGGLCVGLVGFPWFGEMLERFAGLPSAVAWCGQLAFSAWTAVPFGLWVVAFGDAPVRGRWAWVWPCVLWVALATVWPAVFPYTPVIGFAEVPQWMQAAELFGVAACEAQVVACGVLLARTVMPGDRRARVQQGIVALALPLASLGLGQLRMDAVDRELAGAPKLEVGIVQPNAPLLAHDPFDKMARLWSMSLELQNQGAELIVWPEAGTFPYRTYRPFVRDFVEPSRRVMRVHETPTIFGAASITRGERYEYNTVYAMDGEGNVVGAFDKNILVPFGEYVPLIDPDWAIDQIPSISHNHAGEGPARFEMALGTPPRTVALGPVVCYEDIFIEFSRQVAAQPGGIDAFVNVTIDTWFGFTAEPWEHLALAQFRSVEHRVPMVRSVAAGPASAIDATGRLAASLPLRDPRIGDPIPPESLLVEVALARNTASAPTVFARGGWLARWLCLAWVLGRAAAALWQRRRARRSEA